jgi:hypothetical protein
MQFIATISIESFAAGWFYCTRTFIDPDNTAVTLDIIEPAAAVGKQLRLELVDES